jgi:hypothetical protein
MELNYDNINTPQSKRNLLQPTESKIKDIYSKIKRKRMNHNFVGNKKITHLEKDDRYIYPKIKTIKSKLYDITHSEPIEVNESVKKKRKKEKKKN